MALGRLEIVARWVVEGFLQGLHRSPRKGFSVEFAEHRPYQPGDDLRYMDWKVVGARRSVADQAVEEETNLRASIVLDVSKSMDWTGDPSRATKLRYAEMITAVVSLLLLKQRDAVGLVRFDSIPRTIIPPRAKLQQWMRIRFRSLSEDGSGKRQCHASPPAGGEEHQAPRARLRPVRSAVRTAGILRCNFRIARRGTRRAGDARARSGGA